MHENVEPHFEFRDDLLRIRHSRPFYRRLHRPDCFKTRSVSSTIGALVHSRFAVQRNHPCSMAGLRCHKGSYQTQDNYEQLNVPFLSDPQIPKKDIRLDVFLFFHSFGI